ncbi:MAG: glycosyltransferase, partial [Marmoricola sp.]
MIDTPATAVVAVVVTWNRRDLLRESLTALEAQTLAPVRIVVVDNASTDETSDMLAADFGHLDLVTLDVNTVGAGGFAVGVERALTFGPDLVWLLDDDTVPTETTAERLVAAWSSYAPGGPRPAVLASR